MPHQQASATSQIQIRLLIWLFVPHQVLKTLWLLKWILQCRGKQNNDDKEQLHSCYTYFKAVQVGLLVKGNRISGPRMSAVTENIDAFYNVLRTRT